MEVCRRLCISVQAIYHWIAKSDRRGQQFEGVPATQPKEYRSMNFVSERLATDGYPLPKILTEPSSEGGIKKAVETVRMFTYCGAARNARFL